MNWFKSYLQNKNFFVSIGEFRYKQDLIRVPLGPSLGPILSHFLSVCFQSYISQIIYKNNVSYHADDTQIYDCHPVEKLIECIDRINNWMYALLPCQLKPQNKESALI